MKKAVKTKMHSPSHKIYLETMRLIENEELHQTMAKAVNPYGDGRAAERIVNILLNRF